MKAFQFQFVAFCFLAGSWGAVTAQNEGKHLGSTQDELRRGVPLHTRAAVHNEAPPPNEAGWKYQNSKYSPETGMYLDDQWQQGYAVLNDQSRMDHLLLRYDIYNQQLQFISGGDTLAFSNPAELDYVQIDGKRFVYRDFEHNGMMDQGYFEVLKEGDCQLLLRRTVSHHICRDNNSGSGEDEYLRNVTYYVKKDDQVAREVRACKKSVYCVFEDEKDRMKEFIRTNDLRMKSCEDLIQVVSFYNSLQ